MKKHDSTSQPENNPMPDYKTDKVFDPKFIWQLIIQALFIGIVVTLAQTYFQSKFQPTTALETLRVQTNLNSKKEVYFQAMELMNRHLAFTDFTVNGKLMDTTHRIRGTKYPSEYEINSCFSKLCVYCEDNDIVLAYWHFFVDKNRNNVGPIKRMREFVGLIRKDLGNGDITIDTTKDQYQYIVSHRDTSTR
jgi:hypothetical protein